MTVWVLMTVWMLGITPVEGTAPDLLGTFPTLRDCKAAKHQRVEPLGGKFVCMRAE